ncbi:MAG: coproporphyrinogen dehydrogenase HemZ, partial [Alicyclobacillus sp. RIFOXYA1_FULL_53_8]
PAAEAADAAVQPASEEVPPAPDARSPQSEGFVISLRLENSGDQTVAAGSLEHQGERREATHTKLVPPGAQAITWRKRGKQAVLHVLHQLLEAATGEHQPWGILTGVRPLKLVHNMQEQGQPDAQIRQQLLEEYLLSSERTDLLIEIADRQKRVVPDLYQLDKEISIYVGIPFCPTHCAYCTFPAYSMVDKATYVDAFLAAMDLEFAHLGRLLQEYKIPVTSVYIGGGTPTSLRAGELQQLMEMIYRDIPNPAAWREFTVEAGRPDTITPDRVEVMRKYGVNRISVNPQTFKASTLKQIGRGHTPDIVDHRFHYVRDAGFTNINMDMILGLPGETVDDVRYTMERIERLNPDSVTVHTMSFKRTAVVNQERNRFEIPHSQVVRQMMRESTAWARERGYLPYYVYRQKDILGNMENIGFSRAGKESVYNICIMEERQTIVGIGGGAVTKLIGPHGKHLGRFANPREPKAFVETIGQVVEKKDELLKSAFEAIPTR